MDFLPADFHFVRPLWLLGCIPAVILFVSLWVLRLRATSWKKAISSSLLPHLLDNVQEKRRNWPLIFVLIAWLLCCVSLAGPVWNKLPQPVQKKENALIIIQDLSLSFYAQDLSPNRLTRAQHKLTDILKKRKEGTTALIVYSGDAHIVTPLTDDTTTIVDMIPALSPGIMPSYGSNITAAVQKAVQLLKDSGITQGRILLLTDEVEKKDAVKVENFLKGKNIPLLILGIGTNDGGPIPMNKGGFYKDSNGNIIVPRLNDHVLRDLAAGTKGRYSEIKIDDKDIEYLLAAEHFMPQEDEYKQLDRDFDQWEETGYWLLLFVLPVALLAFRKGWILVFIFMVSSFSNNDAFAMSWQDLWLTKDQQAQKAMENDDPAKAAELFQSQNWKGVAEYKAGDFPAAAETFTHNENADSIYNQGNALAKAGKYENALKAYDKALQLDPDMEDARFNKKLIEKMLQQQQQPQQGQDQQQENDQNQESKDQQQSDSNQSGSSDQQQQSDSNQSDSSDQQQGQKNDQQQQQNENQNQENAQDQESQQSSVDKEKEKDQQKADSAEQAQKERSNEEEKESSEENKMTPAEESKEDNSDQQQDEEQAQVVEGQMTEDEEELTEEEQALQQWLRQVPDNPGGLLRRKFEYESQSNRRKNTPRQGEKIW